jgi:hypothetical protein
MSDEFDISREAAARRYVELHAEPLAVVFSHNGVLAYSDWSPEFPHMCLDRRQALPTLPSASGTSRLSGLEAVDASDWLYWPNSAQVWAQTLHQKDGRATTMLAVAVQDEPDVNDAYSHFTRFGKN